MRDDDENDDDDDDDDKDDDDDVTIKLQSNLAITDVMEHKWTKIVYLI